MNSSGSSRARLAQHGERHARALRGARVHEQRRLRRHARRERGRDADAPGDAARRRGRRRCGAAPRACRRAARSSRGCRSRPGCPAAASASRRAPVADRGRVVASLHRGRRGERERLRMLGVDRERLRHDLGRLAGELAPLRHRERVGPVGEHIGVAGQALGRLARRRRRTPGGVAARAYERPSSSQPFGSSGCAFMRSARRSTIATISGSLTRPRAVPASSACGLPSTRYASSAVGGHERDERRSPRSTAARGDDAAPARAPSPARRPSRSTISSCAARPLVRADDARGDVGVELARLVAVDRGGRVGLGRPRDAAASREAAERRGRRASRRRARTRSPRRGRWSTWRSTPSTPTARRSVGRASRRWKCDARRSLPLGCDRPGPKPWQAARHGTLADVPRR